ncbi:MAG: class I SAM-dependent methyltransferase [Acidobacteria bacterium]|nr:class I SAM-dependent methyltransferase [Acidobacteriota bacterium]
MTNMFLFINRLRHKLRFNNFSGAKRNIHDHYDLGNDFFKIFLDRRWRTLWLFHIARSDIGDCAD